MEDVLTSKEFPAMPEPVESETETETTVEKEWFHAVKAYNENHFRSPTSFLVSDIAHEFGLYTEDLREFRRAVTSFDRKWQAAAKVYMEGKFATPKKFFSSGKFLQMGFSPSREHADVLRFALKFYEEETRYRSNADSDAVAAAGRWGGYVQPLVASPKTHVNKAVALEDNDVSSALSSGDDTPTPIGLDHDMSLELSSRASADSSVTCSLVGRLPRAAYLNPEYIEGLLFELSGDGKDPIGGMIFFTFAIIPLVIFAKICVVVTILFPIWDLDEKKSSEEKDIEDEWEKMRETVCFVDDNF